MPRPHNSISEQNPFQDQDWNPRVPFAEDQPDSQLTGKKGEAKTPKPLTCLTLERSTEGLARAPVPLSFFNGRGLGSAKNDDLVIFYTEAKLPVRGTLTTPALCEMATVL